MEEHSDRVESVAALPPERRFLRAANLCRRHDLERLAVLGELVKTLSELIHGLQRERGASSIVLGSHGESYKDRVDLQVAQCKQLERVARARLEHIDQQFEGMSFGARFYTRGALAFRALDALSGLREQIVTLAIAPQDAVKAFSDIIACLLAVGFEVADIAADPQISRALISLANFAQGKEYAGQERATAGAGYSRGQFDAVDLNRLRHLIAAQDQAFRVFADFASAEQIAAFQHVQCGLDMVEVKRMRQRALDREQLEHAPEVVADAWFKHSTVRIDALKMVEDQITADLKGLCDAKLGDTNLAQTDTLAATQDQINEAGEAAPVAMLVTDANPALNNFGLSGGVGLYRLDGTLPQPMHSIMDVIDAQSRRLNDVSLQLESARAALAERKAIERAKGLLMASRRLSEKQAYELMRQTAMTQNKRIYEVAEAVISMAHILKLKP
jgi:AmiR/NasT family two-component response regulator